MAWNGSGGAVDVLRKGERRHTAGSGAAPRPVPSANSKNPLRGILAALVVIGASLSWWTLSRTTTVKMGETVRQKTKPAQQPRENQRQASPTKAESLPADERRTVTGKIIKVPRNPFGTPIPKDLEYKALWEYTPEDYARVDPGYAARHERFLAAQAANPWKTPSDRSLAMLMFAKDGNMGLLIPFDARFKDKFLKSLEIPIEIDVENDSEELQAQKRDMIEVRNFLKERVDAGEDIVEILNDTYRHNKRIADLRNNLQRELRELEKTAQSVEEVQDYIDAANKMLEREGAGRIGLPLALTRYRLSRQKVNQGGQ